MGSTGAEVRDVAVAFSRSLGEPSRDFVVLAEGKTSLRDDIGTMLVNVSGSPLPTATPDNFVHVDWTALIAVVDSDTEAGDVAHTTHPTPVVSLVVLGRHPLLVGCLDPGPPLARTVVRNRAAHGQTARVTYLADHGVFALGRVPGNALAITTMAVKCARVQNALAVGHPTYLDDALAARVDTRLDEPLRRARLAET